LSLRIPLPAAGLHFVSTPIGTASDITLRALDILSRADLLVAEDTRALKKLMAMHGLDLGTRHVMAYHDHSGPGERAQVVEAVLAGKVVAYASEAGTPLLADPGFALSRAVREADGAVFSAPGASALLAALVVAGQPTDRFLFAGFPPPKLAARRAFLSELAGLKTTLVSGSPCQHLPRTDQEVRRGAKRCSWHSGTKDRKPNAQGRDCRCSWPAHLPSSQSNGY